MKKIKLILTFCVLILIFYLFWVYFFLLGHFIHETGHMLFGTLGSLLNGRYASFTFSNWVSIPCIPFVKFPQQTQILSGYKTGGFILGGTFLILLFSFLISFVLIRRNRPFLALFFFLTFSLYELIGNFICGTDNFNGGPYPVSVCNQPLQGFLLLSLTFLFSFIMVYLLITSEIFKMQVKKIISD